jgi:hypothetical protein
MCLLPNMWRPRQQNRIAHLSIDVVKDDLRTNSGPDTDWDQTAISLPPASNSYS